MLRRSWVLSALAALPLIACGPPAAQEKDEGDQRVEIPAPPAEGEGLQFVMPESTVPAGEERMICWIPDFVPDHDYLITHFTGLQGPSGHHVVALSSAVPREPGTTFDCTQIEMMTSLEPLILPDTGAATPPLPEGYAVKLPKGTKIVIQSHYVNASKTELKVRDVAQFTLAPAGSSPTMVSYFILNQGDVKIPAKAEHTSSFDCTVPMNMKVLNVLGHMHEWGRSVKVEHTRSAETTVLYEVNDWTVGDRDEPPVTQYPPEQPLQLQEGDTMRLTCNWMNDSDKELKFPSEMCTSVMYYFPADDVGMHLCE